MLPDLAAQFQSALNTFLMALMGIWAQLAQWFSGFAQQLGLGAVLFAVLLHGGAQTDTLATWAPLLL